MNLLDMKEEGAEVTVTANGRLCRTQGETVRNDYNGRVVDVLDVTM